MASEFGENVPPSKSRPSFHFRRRFGDPRRQLPPLSPPQEDTPSLGPDSTEQTDETRYQRQAQPAGNPETKKPSLYPPRNRWNPDPSEPNYVNSGRARYQRDSDGMSEPVEGSIQEYQHPDSVDTITRRIGEQLEAMLRENSRRSDGELDALAKQYPPGTTTGDMVQDMIKSIRSRRERRLPETLDDYYRRSSSKPPVQKPFWSRLKFW